LSAVPEDLLRLVSDELQANELSIPTLRGLSEATVLEELYHVLYPKRHEGLIPPYGVLLAPAPPPSLAPAISCGLGREVGSGLRKELLRRFADGRQTFVYYAGTNSPVLLRLETSASDELELLNLAHRVGEGLVLKRRKTGLVTIVWQDKVFTVRDREWLVRTPPLGHPIRALWQACGIEGEVAGAVAQRMLQLCWYVLSPQGIGATFVWYLREPSDEDLAFWREAQDVTSLQLNVQREADYGEIVHLARHWDGAVLVGPGGDVRLIKGQLGGFKERTIDIVKEFRGTRHTSARRFSYEHEKTIAFVVSQDGGLTKFSDGAIVADFPVVSAKAEATGPQPGAPGHDPAVTFCGKCRKQVEVHEVKVGGAQEVQQAKCPVCEEALGSAIYAELLTVVRKSLP
jgi:hypothetical protein